MTRTAACKIFRQACVGAAVSLLVACGGTPEKKPEDHTASAPLAPAAVATVASEAILPASIPAGAEISETSQKTKPAVPSGSLVSSTDQSTTPRLIVSGRVTYSDGAPATGTIIALQPIPWKEGEIQYPRPPRQTRVDSNGFYRLELADWPVFNIQVLRPGAMRGGRTLRDEEAIRRGGIQTGVRELEENFVIPREAIVRGRVVDEHNRPIPKARLELSPPIESSQTPAQPRFYAGSDAQGLFSFDQLTSGPAQLWVSAAGFVPLTQRIEAPDEHLVVRMESTGATLEGYVFLKPTGVGVPGAKVWLYPGPKSSPQLSLMRQPMSATTDASGFFRFTPLAAENYVVRAEKDGLMPLTSNDAAGNAISLADGETRPGVNLYLFEGHTIRGKATDHDTGEPLAGVRVSQMYDNEFQTTTGEDGTYILKGLRTQHYALAAEKEGFLFYSTQQNPMLQINLTPAELETTLNFEMIAGVSVSGIVKDSSSKPVAEAKITSLYFGDMNQTVARATAAADGTFRLFSLPSSRLRLKAEAPGFPFGVSGQIEVGTEPISGVEITLAQGAEASGVVLDPQERPVEKANVSIYTNIGFESGGRSLGRGEGVDNAKTDSEGRFEFKNLPSLPMQTSAAKIGFANSQILTFALQPGERRTDLRLVLGQSHHIAGRVTDIEGTPIANIQVKAFVRSFSGASSGNVQTDEQGRYRVEGLGDGLAIVSVYAPQYEGQQFESVPIDRDDVDFVLKKLVTTTFIGRVVDWKTRAPVREFSVSSRSGITPVPDPSSPGQFIVENALRGMHYEVTIESPGYIALSTGFSVSPADERCEQTFEIGPGGSVRGRVVAQSTNAPLPGARADLYRANDEGGWMSPEQTAMPGDDGQFQFRAVTTGNHSLKFAHRDYPQPVFKRVQIKQGEEADLGDIVFGGGKVIRGRIVRNPGEQPIAAAKIEVSGNDNRYGSANFSTQSDDSGWFEFKGLSEGYYTIQASEYRMSVSADLQNKDTADVVLRIGAVSVTGRVLYRGQPHRSNVNFGSNKGLGCSVPTNDEGRFSINLSPGAWNVNISSREIVRLFGSDTIDVPELGAVEKTFRLPGGRIVGRVVDSADKPMSKVLVIAAPVEPPSASSRHQRRPMDTRTIWDGTFTVFGLDPGVYGVTAVTEDSSMGRADNVQVPLDGDSPPVVIRIGAYEGATIVSKVFDLNTGKPVPNSFANLSSIPPAVWMILNSRHDSEGVAKITGILEGHYGLVVGAEYYSSAYREIDLHSGETVEFEDAIYPAGTLRWKIVDRDGKPIGGLRCSLSPNDPLSIEKIRGSGTDPQGMCQFGQLYPGDYTGTATFPDNSTLTETFTIIVGKTTDKTTRRE